MYTSHTPVWSLPDKEMYLQHTKASPAGPKNISKMSAPVMWDLWDFHVYPNPNCSPPGLNAWSTQLPYKCNFQVQKTRHVWQNWGALHPANAFFLPWRETMMEHRSPTCTITATSASCYNSHSHSHALGRTGTRTFWIPGLLQEF